MKEESHHVYVIKQRKTIDLTDSTIEYEELLGKCTSPDEAKKILNAHPGAYISEDSTYTENDLFRYD